MIGVVIEEFRGEAGQIGKEEFTQLKDPGVRSSLLAKKSVHRGILYLSTS